MRNFYVKTIYLLICGLCCLNCVTAQTIFVKQDFSFSNANAKIPYGEKLLLRSENFTPSFNKLTITIYSGSKQETIAANVTNQGWTALIGPFDQKQKLLFSFTTYETLSNEQWTSIYDSVERNLNNVFEAMVENGIYGNENIFIDSFKSKMRMQIPGTLKNYTTNNNQKAYDFFKTSLETRFSFKALKELFNQWEKAKLEKDNFKKYLQEIKNNKKVTGKDSLYFYEWRNDKRFQEITINDDTLKIKEYQANLLSKPTDSVQTILNVLNKLSSFIAKYQQAAMAAKEIIKEAFLPDNLQFATEFVQTTHPTETSVDVSGIDRYIGVDIGQIFYERKQANYGSFVLISPFLRKTEPEDDIHLGKNCWRNFTNLVNLTFGMALVTTPKQDSATITWFAGASLRLNKLVRITVGDAFYIKDNRFFHSLGLGVSISAIQFGNLLRAVGGAASNVKN